MDIYIYTCPSTFRSHAGGRSPFVCCPPVPHRWPTVCRAYRACPGSRAQKPSGVGDVTGVLPGTMLTALQLSPPLGVDPDPSPVRNSSGAMVANVVVASSSSTTPATLSSPSGRRSPELLVDFGIFRLSAGPLALGDNFFVYRPQIPFPFFNINKSGLCASTRLSHT